MKVVKNLQRILSDNATRCYLDAMQEKALKHAIEMLRGRPGTVLNRQRDLSKETV